MGLTIHDDETFERTLKRFGRACQKAEILSDRRRHGRFEELSARRKRTHEAARNNRGQRVH